MGGGAYCFRDNLYPQGEPTHGFFGFFIDRHPPAFTLLFLFLSPPFLSL